MDEKKLGFGYMRLPLTDETDQKSIDDPQLMQMADLFLERGFTYFDTAYMYHEFTSEAALNRTVVQRYPRDAFTVASKMPMMSLTAPEDQVRIFAEQLSNVGVEYFDYYLLHNIHVVHYATARKYDTFAFLEQQKKQGRIRQLGFSYHDNAALLDQILTDHPEMDFVQLQINYLDWDNEGIQSRKCYEVARKHQKPIIVMEPVKGGTLVKLPEAAEQLLRSVHPDWSMPSWAIRFAAGLEGVMTVLSGMSNMAQLEENTGFMEHFTPLTPEEQKVLFQARDLINQTATVPCTGCRYCVEGDSCPQHILIPNYFDLYNAEVQDINPDWSPQTEYYNNLVQQGNGKASDCIRCGQCERACPQHIPITSWLKQVAKTFEETPV